MSELATFQLIEQSLQRLVTDGSDKSIALAEEVAKMLQGMESHDQSMESPPEHAALATLFASNPWLAADRMTQSLTAITRENASVKSKRRKMIAIANRVTAALEPHVACKPECSDCCYLNTMIYEHEALLLAEITGRKMVRLPYRPLEQVALEGIKFSGKACPFLAENKCSVYESRPLVCRTHHSLHEDASRCSLSAFARFGRPPMYDPDILEMPYMAMNASTNPTEPWGNIAEFFPE